MCSLSSSSPFSSCCIRFALPSSMSCVHIWPRLCAGEMTIVRLMMMMMKMTITTMMLMMMAIAGMRLPALCLLRANRWFMLLCPRLAWPALPRTMQRGKVKVSSWNDHGGSYSFAHDFPRTLLWCQCKITWGFTNLCLQSSSHYGLNFSVGSCENNFCLFS